MRHDHQPIEGERGVALLRMAVELEDWDLVRALMVRGADCHAADRDGRVLADSIILPKDFERLAQTEAEAEAVRAQRRMQGVLAPGKNDTRRQRM